MKLVIEPLALISDLVVGVVQCPSALHFVSVPLAHVLPSLSVVEDAVAVAEVIQFVALVSADVELLPHVYGSGGLFGVQCTLLGFGLWF